MIYDTIITPEITRLFLNQLKWGFFLIKNIWSLGKIVKMSKLYFELIEYLTRLFLFILLLVMIINSGSPGQNSGRNSGQKLSGRAWRISLPCRRRFLK